MLINGELREERTNNQARNSKLLATKIKRIIRTAKKAVRFLCPTPILFSQNLADASTPRHGRGATAHLLGSSA